MAKRVSELTGADLALWVARASGLNAEVRSYELADGRHFYCNVRTVTRSYPFSPHDCWPQGGPLLDELISDGYGVYYTDGGALCTSTDPDCVPFNDDWTRMNITEKGDTPLVAICRAFVARKYGETVPDEVVL